MDIPEPHQSLASRFECGLNLLDYQNLPMPPSNSHVATADITSHHNDHVTIALLGNDNLVTDMALPRSGDVATTDLISLAPSSGDEVADLISPSNGLVDSVVVSPSNDLGAIDLLSPSNGDHVATGLASPADSQQVATDIAPPSNGGMATETAVLSSSNVAVETMLPSNSHVVSDHLAAPSAFGDLAASQFPWNGASSSGRQWGQAHVGPTRQLVSPNSFFDACQSQGSFPTILTESIAAYITQVIQLLAFEPLIYKVFCDILKDFRLQVISTADAIRCICRLFRGHHCLILGFKAFLPVDYRLDLQTSASGARFVVVTTPNGMTETISIADEGPPDPVRNDMAVKNTCKSKPTGAVPHTTRPPSSTPIFEWCNAILFAEKVRRQFAHEPDTHATFLELLSVYAPMLETAQSPSRTERPIIETEFYQAIYQLLQGEPTLLQEFSQFIPDISHKRTGKSRKVASASNGSPRLLDVGLNGNAHSDPADEYACPICLETLVQLKKSKTALVSVICGHVFCEPCLKAVLRKAKPVCPSCRMSLRRELIHPLYL